MVGDFLAGFRRVNGEQLIVLFVINGDFFRLADGGEDETDAVEKARLRKRERERQFGEIELRPADEQFLSVQRIACRRDGGNVP